MWKKGQSGNPNGRPVNTRALSKLIERELSRTVLVSGQARRVARKRIMADLLAQAATTGKVQFLDGRVVKFTAREWSDFVFRLLKHVEGLAPIAVDMSSKSDGIVRVKFVGKDDG